MNTGLERHIDMIALNGETADEIAQDYARVCNDAYRNAVPQFSRKEMKMMIYAPYGMAPRCIKDKWFAEIEWVFYAADGEDDEDTL